MSSSSLTARSTRSASSACSRLRSRARRWRCGAATRWPTSPTSRSPPPRSAASTSCGCARPRARSTATWPPDATSRCSASSSGWSPRIRCVSTCARSTCSRCTARVASRRRWPPSATRATELVEQIGVEPGAELRRLQDAILAQDPALDLRRAGAASRRRRPSPARSPGSAAEAPGAAAAFVLAGVTTFGVIRVLEPDRAAGHR